MLVFGCWIVVVCMFMGPTKTRSNKTKKNKNKNSNRCLIEKAPLFLSKNEQTSFIFLKIPSFFFFQQ